MNNTITFSNPNRQKTKLAVYIMLIFVVLFLVFEILNIMILRTTLNGMVRSVDGILTEAKTDDDGDVGTVKLDGVEYNAIFTEYGDINLNDYIGKSVTLVIPQSQFGNGDKWAVGFIADDMTLVDGQTVIENKTREYKLLMLCIGIIGAVFALAAVVLVVLTAKMPKTKEYSVAQGFCIFSLPKQKSAPQTKRAIIFMLVFGVIIGLSLLGIMALSEYEKEMSRAAFIATAVCLSVAAVSCAAGIALVYEWSMKKNIEFYDKNFPFDFSDISHAPLRKVVKEQLQNNIIAERQKHPHRYGDGGNGFWVDFTSDGVELRIEEDCECDESLPQENVFEEFESGEENLRDGGEFVGKLSYEQLDFEALPFYFKQYPLAVVIKSRLKDGVVYPDGLVNDLHFMLDSNLLSTFGEFGVKAENLEHILDNKKRLMLDNRRKAKNISQMR